MYLFKQMERAFSVCGTIEYMAPEIVEGGESGHDKVIYSFELVSCCLLFDQIEQLRLSLRS